MKIRYELLVAVSLTIGILLAYYYLKVLPSNELAKSHKYTIGTVTKLEVPDNGSESMYFQYNINGRTFFGSFSVLPDYEGKLTKGSRVYVMYSPIDPDNSTVIYDKFIPDNLVPPLNGWKEIPNL